MANREIREIIFFAKFVSDRIKVATTITFTKFWVHETNKKI